MKTREHRKAAGGRTLSAIFTMSGHHLINRQLRSHRSRLVQPFSRKKAMRPDSSHALRWAGLRVILTSPDMTTQPPSEPRVEIHSISDLFPSKRSRRCTMSPARSRSSTLTASTTLRDIVLSKKNLKPQDATCTQSRPSPSQEVSNTNPPRSARFFRRVRPRPEADARKGQFAQGLATARLLQEMTLRDFPRDRHDKG